jgi:hypothetical protein
MSAGLKYTSCLQAYNTPYACRLTIHLDFLLSAGKMEDEVNSKKLPRSRKANFSPLEESILQNILYQRFCIQILDV